MTNIVGTVDTQLRPSLSFVVPVKDEEATLEILFRGIAAQATNLASHWEVIFVDDGSSDGSWRVIRQLAAQDEEHVKAIRFRINVGKAEALAAGWKECKGDFVFTMDADLQDDPEEIPRFLEKMREGFDVVTGWKRTRHDPWHKVLPSRIFNYILSRVNKVELHDHNCGFKCYWAEVVRTLPMYGEMHRMVPSLAAMHGFRTAEIAVKHHPRRHGRSKYGLQRFLRGFLDMWTVQWTVHFLQNFRQRPMHLMGTVSLLMLGVACFIALFLAKVRFGRIAARRHDVTVIAPSYSGLKNHLIDGTEVRRFRYAPARLEKLTHGEGAPNKLKKNPFLKVLTLTYLLAGIWLVWRVCREKRIEILHVHWPFPHGLMALLPAWLARVKIVSSCHGAEIALAARNRLSTCLLATCLRRSNAVTANSRHTADLIQKISGVQAELMPYGATVRIDPPASGPPDRPGIPLLLFSGRLIQRKGVNFLLRAMPLILAERQARLVITGDGHCRAEWEALSGELGVADRVSLSMPACIVNIERTRQSYLCRRHGSRFIRRAQTPIHSGP